VKESTNDGGLAAGLLFATGPRARIQEKRLSMSLMFSRYEHLAPQEFSDRFAWRIARGIRHLAQGLFARRYCNRAVVLEAISGVPAMVSGIMQHVRTLRSLEDDRGWISVFLDEAENQRVQLMTFCEVLRPSWLERAAVLLAQGGFYCFFFTLYLLSRKTAHRLAAYLMEESVEAYTEYIDALERNDCPNPGAPPMAIEYWSLPAEARMREVALAIRGDEIRHRDDHHEFADSLRR
jgi:ubiquinol oxidase